MKKENFEAILIGQMAGDSVGLPYEFLSPLKAAKRFQRQGVAQSFLGAWGILSDDSEHILFTAEALLESRNAKEFGFILQKKLRNWFLAFPPGIGLTTLKAASRILIGKNYNTSGVDSMGNGPAMRVNILAAFFQEDREKLLAYLKVSTYLTHKNPVVLDACISQANLLQYLCQHKAVPHSHIFDILSLNTETKEWRDTLQKLAVCIEKQLSPKEVLKILGVDARKGVSGYILHSMPFALYCAICYPELESCLSVIIRTGGDTDSVAAVSLGLLGAIYPTGYFQDLSDKIIDYPYCVAHAKKLSVDLEKKHNTPTLVFHHKLCWPVFWGRNVLAFIFIFAHALGRFRPTSWY